MGYGVLSQLGQSFTQAAMFQIGNFNLADFALNLQSAFLASSFVHYLEIISGIITAVLFFLCLRLAAQQREFKKKTILETEAAIEAVAPGGIIQEQWQDILRHLESTREGEWKFAVIEADTITDSILKNYFPGDTMGERLMNIDKTNLVSIDGLWEAHKVRNRLAHDPNYFLRHAEAIRAIRLYEATLKELGAVS